MTSHGPPVPSLLVRGILFDCDGVLVDSLESVDRTWHRFALELGLDPAYVLTRHHGRPARETIAEVAPHHDLDLAVEVLENLEVGDSESVTALPGAAQLLDCLPTGSWTVVTSATRRLAEVRLGAAGLPVPPTVVTADQVANGKPNPEPYLTGATRLGLPPETCVVFEDSRAGIVAGLAAGSLVVQVQAPHAEPHGEGVPLIADLRSVTPAVGADGMIVLGLRPA
ncbi:MAG: HAD-IA family hydrolase [Actinomycetia bacterium]|nr:HAD-IA family hydrolase [Actinomycetes bacterium]